MTVFHSTRLHLCRTSPFPRYPCAVVPDWKTSAPWEVQTPSSSAALMGPGRHSGWVCIRALDLFCPGNLHCEHVAVFVGFLSVLKWTAHISKCWGHGNNISVYVFEQGWCTLHYNFISRWWNSWRITTTKCWVFQRNRQQTVFTSKAPLIETFCCIDLLRNVLTALQ